MRGVENNRPIVRTHGEMNNGGWGVKEASMNISVEQVNNDVVCRISDVSGLVEAEKWM